MCGIVGAIAQRPVADILMEGLRRLEYRGYDSAGIACLEGSENDQQLQRLRALGKVHNLQNKLNDTPLSGQIGIAHTRWATHGEPSELNAHPHMSRNRVTLVHNGIIENHRELKQELLDAEVSFESQTDTEVIVHLVEARLQAGDDLFAAVKHTLSRMEGAYALAVMSIESPDKMVIARQGSPLIIGLGIGENFIGSDTQAMLPVTNRFIYLENGDMAELSRYSIRIEDKNGNEVERKHKESSNNLFSTDLGQYRHYMQKEIFEQPFATQATLEGRLGEFDVQPNILQGNKSLEAILPEVREVQIVACGTSYHAALVAKYWFEDLLGLPCNVEVASEYRYRKHPQRNGMLFVTLSQSGETADTLAALNQVKQDNACLASLVICNVAESSLTRESDFTLMTMAGPEIGVASTKAFVTQLVALQLLMLMLAQYYAIPNETHAELMDGLRRLPQLLEQTLELDKTIEKLAERFIDKHNALFLGRAEHYPIAMEGALKLKEISYIHAEAYPAGELKHGPLALVDSEMPVIAVAPNTALLEKLESNLEEVRARGGELYIFADKATGITAQDNIHIIEMPAMSEFLAPIVYTLPLQLLAYYTAVFKGTDVDKPRNLAKSVTVE